MSTPSLTLALETSGRMGSVALGRDGMVLAEKGFSGPLRHSVEILPSIQVLLDKISEKQKAIRQIFLSIGPGSFTGLRIAVTIAKSMHLANQCRIVTVSSLDTIAANVVSPPHPTDHIITPILDAKRGQFFVSAYHHTYPSTKDDPIPRKVLNDTLLSARDILNWTSKQIKPAYLLGDGLVYHQNRFSSENIYILDQSLWSPHAKQVYYLGYKKAQRGEFADPLTLTPHYLREALVTPKRSG